MKRRGLFKAVGAVTMWFGAATSALAASNNREVLAFYYGWYGNPADKADWRGVDLYRRRIENAADYPEAGAYSSADPATVAHQMEQMRHSGVTGIIYSWWGIGSYEDQHLQLVIDTARTYGLKVSIYYEACLKTGESAKGEAVQRDIIYLLDKYAGADNWLMVGNKKAFFIYGDALKQLPLGEWRSILAAARQKYHERLFFSVAAEKTDELDFVDSIHRYALVASAGKKAPAEIESWAKTFFLTYLKEQRHYKITTLTVYPGYDDTRLKRRHTLASGRFDGQLYSALWKSAIPYRPNWILITSWNEWHEGTEIEPSVQFGRIFLNLTALYSKEFIQGG